MSVITDFGALLEQISHDFKNHLGILETLVQDVKDGYRIDFESLEDALLTLRRIYLLSSSIQKSGMVCRKTGSREDFRTGDAALNILGHALAILEEKEAHDPQNEEVIYTLSIQIPEVEEKASISLTGSTQTPDDILAILSNTDSVKDASIRTLVSIFKLTLKMSGISECLLYLNTGIHTNEPLLSYELTLP